VVLIALINSAGLVISLFMNVPSGPCITLVAGFIFVFDYCIYRMRKRLLYKLTGGLK
jgi:ABC-type Mn2+/Zn2+ transport system permease subunit